MESCDPIVIANRFDPYPRTVYPVGRVVRYLDFIILRDASAARRIWIPIAGYKIGKPQLPCEVILGVNGDNALFILRTVGRKYSLAYIVDAFEPAAKVCQKAGRRKIGVSWLLETE